MGWRLDGKAKAMVVTSSRKAAVRYKLAFDKYVAEQGYTDIAALVAFSREVTDPESGVDKATETSMNPGLKGRDLRKAFATDEYQVMLVANKFQTGFDQSLLVAMYVDKRLSGVAAVQTLSRLNRVAPGKDQTFVATTLAEVTDRQRLRRRVVSGSGHLVELDARGGGPRCRVTHGSDRNGEHRRRQAEVWTSGPRELRRRRVLFDSIAAKRWHDVSVARVTRRETPDSSSTCTP